MVIFKGFNGTDDLHYAMLAANMLKGAYNPIAAGDIFSGRVLLIAWQALFYRIGGISIFTTQAPALLAAVIACRLTVFKLAKAGGSKQVIVAASLFYFNPVLTYATDGILPDVYVMLAGIIALLLWNNSQQISNNYKNTTTGIAMAITIVTGFFFKETAIVFPVLIVFLALLKRSKVAMVTCAAMLAALFAFAIIIGFVYYHYTGHVFYRLQQMEDSSYYNPCSYDLLPASFLYTRLTYGVWKLFLANGFYPVLFAAGIICGSFFLHPKLLTLRHNATQCFILLIVIALYLPFSFKGYQPLCSDSPRHFLFLLPFAVCVCVPYLLPAVALNKTTGWLAISCICLAICMVATPDKWQWMVWGLLIVYFYLQHRISSKKKSLFTYTTFGLILWLCMPYRLFYNNNNWFAGMLTLNKQLTGTHYYFADHDNMMHWKLLHGFSNTVHCYSIAPAPYKVFGLYYEKIYNNQFDTGWCIINKRYTERTEKFLSTITSMIISHYFSKQITTGDMLAVYISQPYQLEYMQQLVWNDEKVFK